MSAATMTDITFRSDLVGRLVQQVGGDESVVASARVSTKGVESMFALVEDPKEAEGLVRFLMKNRHGTPFEHNSFTFLVEAPIKVFREFHRHRIGWSYNEESGRYKQLAPVFYLPPPERPLVQVGKPGAYTFVPGSPEQYARMVERHKRNAGRDYESYLEELADDVAKEVARDQLPVSIYSSMYATCNARSLMAYLSLRTTRTDATFPSSPMWEIERVADELEAGFAQHMPITYAAWNDFGRVAP